MKTELSRRTMLKGAGVAGMLAAVGSLIGQLPTGALAATPQEFVVLRSRWVDQLTGRKTIVPGDPDFASAIERVDKAVSTAMPKLVADQNRTTVFSDLKFTSDVQMRATFTRLEQMATAWATPGSAFESDEGVLKELLRGLADTHRLVYNDGQQEFGNWWNWEIGSTRSLANIMAIAHEHLSAEEIAAYCAAIDHFIPDPRYQFPDSRGKQLSEGANRVDICQAIIVRSIAGDDSTRLDNAVSALSDVWQYVTEGNGFFRDGSFVQHSTLAYTGTYGAVLLRGLAQLFSVLGESSHAVSDPTRSILYQTVEDSFAPVIFDCQMMDFVRGRGISRATEQSHDNAYMVIEAILNLARAVDGETASRWRGICAGWLARDTYGNILERASLSRVSAVKELLSGAPVPLPEPNGPELFPSMDRAIFRGERWAYSLSMSSERIAWYECGNGENNKGYHTGSGMTYLYDSDNGHFDDDFWPTVDLNRLPGITVDKTPLPDKVEGQWGEATPQGGDWTGGVQLGGFAAVGQHLIAPGGTGLKARKSWFFNGTLVVALGSDIQSASTANVETIIENRNLHDDGSNTLTVDGTAVAGRLGESATVDGAAWAHLDGVAGYVLIDQPKVHSVREERTGAWSRINTRQPTDPRTKRYATLWLDHGVGPSAATYAYAVLPGASAEATAAEAAEPSFKVEKNDDLAQVVRFMSSSTTAINAWAATSVGEFRLDQPMALIATRVRNTLEVAVADPTQKATSVTFALVRGGWKRAQSEGVTTRREGNALVVTVDTTNAAGGTRKVNLSQ